MATTIYRSAIPPVELINTSIYSFLFANAGGLHWDLPAFIDAASGDTLSRGHLRHLTLELAYSLQQKGARRGDVTMIFSPNSIAYPAVLFGAWAAGLKTSLASPSFTPPELAHQIKDSNPYFIFVHPMLFPILIKTLALLGVSELEARKRVVIMNMVDQDYRDDYATGIDTRWMRLDDMLARGMLESEEVFLGAQTDETTLLCYSSGTSGQSKGVESTHRNLVSQLQLFGPLSPLFDRDIDVVMGVLPFYHILCVKILLFSFWVGTPVVVHSRFDTAAFCQSIEKYHITLLWIVPPILVTLSVHPVVSKYNMRSVRAMISGGAPLGLGLVDKVRARFAELGNKGVVVGQGYGLTETSPSITFLDLHHTYRKRGSCGTLLPNLEVRLVGPDGLDVPVGPTARGELWVRGPTIMKGYLNNIAATKSAITPDGFFKTGDIVVRDNDGFFTVVDRIKELIKYKGFQVPPADLEKVLLGHPEVLDAGVIGVYSANQATELPRAYIVSRQNSKLLTNQRLREWFEQSIEEWIKGQVGNHKWLRGGVRVVDRIPKSPTGKIVRRALVELAAREELGQQQQNDMATAHVNMGSISMKGLRTRL